MRRRILTAAAVLGGLAALVLILAASPIGLGLASRLAASAVRDASGLELTIGSLRGNLFTHLKLSHVGLAVPRGPRILFIEESTVRYDLLKLRSREVVVHELRIEGGDALLEVGPDGKLVGWSRFRGEEAPRKAQDGWRVRATVDVADLCIAVRDTARGISADVTDLRVHLDGGRPTFSADVAGSLEVATRALRAPVRGRVAGSIEGREDRVLVDRVLLTTGLGTLDLKGEVALAAGGTTRPAATLDLAFSSTVDLAAAAAAGGLADVAGEAAVAGSVRGAVDSPSFEADASSERVSYPGLEVTGLRVGVAGDLDLVEIRSLQASVLGGTVRASGSVVPAGAPRPEFALAASVAGISLSELAVLLPEEQRALAGRLDANVRASGVGQDVKGLRAEFDARVSGLSIREKAVGDVALFGRASGGTLSVQGSVAGVEFSSRASLTGEPDASLSARVADLSILGHALGAPHLTGAGTAEVTVTGTSAAPTIAAAVELPEIAYRGVPAGPVSVAFVGGARSGTARFSAAKSAVSGEIAFEESGHYGGEVHVDSLDLSPLAPDSLRERMAFAGRLGADVSLEGDVGGAYLAQGTVTDLVLSARGEEALLELPFSFEVVPDSVHISWASLRGGFGAASVAGGMSLAAGLLDLTARLDAVDLARLARLAPREAPAVGGSVDGTVRLSGSRRAPEFTADLDVAGLSVAGIDVGSVAFEASGDSADVEFELGVQSAVSGTATASGVVPVVPDSVTILALDRSREFGATITCSGFVLDAGELLPGVRGEKRFSMDGSCLLAGRADSLGSIRGRGLFDDISAGFELVRFSLAEPFAFEVEAGGAWFERLAFAAVRRRALDASGCGTIVARGGVTHEGSVAITAEVSDLDVGRIVRAFVPTAAPFEGTLDLVAAVSGTVGAPRADVTWDMAGPSLAGVAFERLRGRAALEPGVVRIDEAALEARGQSLAVSGTVTLPSAEKSASGHRAASPTLDLAISADRFLLDRLPALPPGVKSVAGELTADLKVHGALGAPSLDGRAALARGAFRGFGLSRPVRDIAVEVEAAGQTVILKGLTARLGDGAVKSTGFVQLGRPEETTFWLKTKLDSPEVAIPRMFDARARGSITWAGRPPASQLSGTITIEKLDVTYPFGLADLITRRQARIVARKPGEARSEVTLDLDVEIADRVSIVNDLASVDLKGGFHVGGATSAPALSGGVTSEGGTVRYLNRTFALETLEMSFPDARRKDPFTNIVATTEVEDRSQEAYLIRLALRGYLFDAVPELTSSPYLSPPDIVAVLTFGDKVGSLFAGTQEAATSGDSFSDLARKAFLGSVFGVAETTLERVLRLDTIALDEEAVMENGFAGADVTVGKRFGDRVRVDYTTAVGRFDEREVEVSLRLAERLSLETRADPEGNHAVLLKLHVPFK